MSFNHMHFIASVGKMEIVSSVLKVVAQALRCTTRNFPRPTVEKFESKNIMFSHVHSVAISREVQL